MAWDWLLACGLLPLFFLAISPRYYAFSVAEVKIAYCFGTCEQIRWDSIGGIPLTGSWGGGGGGLPRYVLAYPCEMKRPFFVCGEIAKTRKTKQLQKMYYHREIH